MVTTMCFGPDDLAVCISTHGWITVWKTAPHGPDTRMMTEMVSAGFTDELGLPYNHTWDHLDTDVEDVPRDELEARFLAWWRSLTAEEHRERARLKKEAHERIRTDAAAFEAKIEAQGQEAAQKKEQK